MLRRPGQPVYRRRRRRERDHRLSVRRPRQRRNDQEMPKREDACQDVYLQAVIAALFAVPAHTAAAAHQAGLEAYAFIHESGRYVLHCAPVRRVRLTLPRRVQSGVSGVQHRRQCVRMGAGSAAADAKRRCAAGRERPGASGERSRARRRGGDRLRRSRSRRRRGGGGRGSRCASVRGGSGDRRRHRIRQRGACGRRCGCWRCTSRAAGASWPAGPSRRPSGRPSGRTSGRPSRRTSGWPSGRTSGRTSGSE